MASKLHLASSSTGAGQYSIIRELPLSPFCQAKYFKNWHLQKRKKKVVFKLLNTTQILNDAIIQLVLIPHSAKTGCLKKNLLE